MGAEKRHVNSYRFLWHALNRTLSHIFRFEAEPANAPPAPYLVLANHNLNLDPALVALSFPEHMYFVASEHVFRKGFASWLLRRYFAPISRMKGATDAQAALDIIRALRRGSSVCLFAEGNRSFSGVTGPVFPATGKLAKISGVPLITYHMTGGYLTQPRWSLNRRKGKMTGACAKVYMPEQLKEMTAEQVNAHIAEDLYEDAFLRQEKERIPFRGKDLAAGLETAFFLCPKCHGVGTMQSSGDRYSCTCGLSVRYNEYGFFEGIDGKEPPFTTTRDWDAWQIEQLEAQQEERAMAFSDKDTQLMAINKRHRMRPVDAGTLRMDGEAITLGQTRLPLDNISDMAVAASSDIMLTANGQHYEIRSKNRYFCGRKYLMLYQIYTQKG